ncbi:hypothetical protein PM082_022375 [Marasmius tenuissimus]|nr:hypothetical protein PM082_022375 [Marasmius tenuissimus]
MNRKVRRNLAGGNWSPVHNQGVLLSEVFDLTNNSRSKIWSRTRAVRRGLICLEPKNARFQSKLRLLCRGWPDGRRLERLEQKPVREGEKGDRTHHRGINGDHDEKNLALVEILEAETEAQRRAKVKKELVYIIIAG